MRFAGVWRGRRRLAGVSLSVLFVGTLALTALPFGDLLPKPLEARNPAQPPLTRVDGIIEPGGAEQTGAHRLWGGPQLNDAGEA